MNVDPDTQTNLMLDANDPEQVALADAAADDQAAADAAKAAKDAEDATAAAAGGEPSAPAAPATPDPADRLAAAADKLGAAAEAIAARATPEPEPAAPAADTPARDYDAELTALEQRYDDGEIELREYRNAERAILREQTREDTLAAVARQQDEARQAALRTAEQTAEEQWNAATATFFKDPGNAALIANNIQKAAFGAAVNEAFAEANGQIGFDEVLVKAREKITGVPAIDPAKAIRDAEFARTKQAGGPAPETLRQVPNASSDTSPSTALDNLPVDQLEDEFMRMTPEAQARYLADAPGGLNDNRRG